MMMTYLIAILLICWVCMTRWPLVVLLFSLPATCVFFLAGLSSEHAGLVLLSPGLFLSCSIYVGFFLASEDHTGVRTLARQLLGGLMLFLLALLVGLIFGPLAMVGVLMFAVWLAAMIAYGSTARRSLLFSVLTTLKTCMKQNLPLPMALECAAQGRTDQEAVVYRRIKTQLVKGYNLVHAIRLAWPQCPGHVTGLLQGAQHAGSLAAGLAAVHKNVTLKEKRRQACEPVHPVYPVIVFAVLVVIGTALFKYVIPQFATTLHEMTSEELPVITRWLLTICMEWGPPVLGALGIGFGLWVVVVITGWLNKGQRLTWIANITDWLRWHLPFVRRFDRMFALIQLFETLNLCLRAGSPLDQAVFQCLELDVNRCFIRQIRTWHRLIVEGQSASSAALKSGLPHAVAWAFDTTVNQGNTPNILSMLEQTYSDRYVYQSNILSLILGPCIIMMLAAMVCFVMLGVFLPMVSTITSLTDIYP
jgi:type II secretory pathway component PulF